MGDWLVGLRKAAVDSRRGATHEEIAAAEKALGLPMPADLRSLYIEMNGGSFEPDVALFGLTKTGDSAGVVEESRNALGGLPGGATWRFGLRGGADHLFASRRQVARGPTSPGASGDAAEVWVFGRKNTDTGKLELFKTLPSLLWKLIPPVEAEDFGENTYVRAMTAVQAALNEVEKHSAAPAATGSKRKAAAKQAKPKAKAKAPAKKPAAKKSKR